MVAPATNCLDDLPDCVDHHLWLLHLYGVAAVRVADVFSVEKLCETIVSGSPRLPRLRSAGAKVKSLVGGKHDNGHWVYPGGAIKQIKGARVVRCFEAFGFDQLLRGFDVRCPLLRRQRGL